MSWCKLEAGISRHPKTLELAAELEVSRREALGLLVDLFTWTILTRPSGIYDGIRPAAIEAALDWSGKPGALVAALSNCRWLDTDADGIMSLHGWQERAERWRRSTQEAERRKPQPAPKKTKKTRKPAEAQENVGGATVAPPWHHRGTTVSPPWPGEERRGEERSPSQEPPLAAVERELGSPAACVSDPAPKPDRPKASPQSVGDILGGAMTAPAPSRSPAAIVQRRPVGGAVVAWTDDGRPLLRCSGQPSEVLQWDYLAATYGADAVVAWLATPDAERRLARVHPGSLHRAIETGLQSRRPPTIADRLASDAALSSDPREQAALAGASALCAAVGRIEERRARQIAAELTAADVDGGPLTPDEVLGGIRAYASERAVLRRSARDGQIDPPEAFDVVHAVKRFAREERGKRAPVPQPVQAQPEAIAAPSRALAVVPHNAPPGVMITSPAPLAYVEGEDEAAALAIRRANGLDYSDEDHAKGIENVRSVLRAMRGGRG